MNNWGHKVERTENDWFLEPTNMLQIHLKPTISKDSLLQLAILYWDNKFAEFLTSATNNFRYSDRRSKLQMKFIIKIRQWWHNRLPFGVEGHTEGCPKLGFQVTLQNCKPPSLPAGMNAITVHHNYEDHFSKKYKA